MVEQPGSTGADKTPVPRQKRPYVKPEIVSEPIYETAAMACGKLPGQAGQCGAAPYKS
jgi:hypothetical protein